MVEQLILVGNASDGTISTFRMGEDRLDELAVSQVGVGCSTFVVVGNLVYVATKAPAIVVCQLDRATGALTQVDSRPIETALAYLEATPDSRMLLGASYHGGWATAWPLDGSRIEDPLSRVEFRNLHSIVVSPDGRFAYAASLGDDLVLVCRVVDAGLELVQQVPVAAGSGPRHVIMSPDAASLYLITEFTGQVIRYARDTGTGFLEARQDAVGYDQERGLGVSRFGADPLAEHLIWGADLHVAGDWLLCSERTESTVLALHVGTDGALGRTGAVSQVETQPRGFTVSLDGSRVVIAGERSGQVGLYRVAPETGELTRLAQAHSGEGPNWVRFA